MPLILVDLLFFTGKKGGMETYTKELYRELGRLKGDLQFVGLASREFVELDHSWFPGELIESGISGEDRVAWAWGEISAVARAARRVDADLIHAPANFGPWRSKTPVVLTVHDLLSYRFPDLAGRLNSLVVSQMVYRASKAARRIVTDSESSALDIRKYLRFEDDRLDVVPLASSHPATVLHRENSGVPIILSTGNRLPHKNFESLLRAVALIEPTRRPRVFITGSHGDDPLRPLVDELGIADSVELTGWITTEKLDQLYAVATLYVIPSRFEGFGLPVLDAMNRGCAVIASDIPVLREVGGDAAVYVDTTDPAALAEAIDSLLGDTERQQLLRIAGAERVAQFSWRRTAEGTLQSFREALRVSDPH